MYVGYAFLLFRDELSVHRLTKMCIAEEGKLFMFVSSVTQAHKKVSNIAVGIIIPETLEARVE